MAEEAQEAERNPGVWGGFWGNPENPPVGLTVTAGCRANPNTYRDNGAQRAGGRAWPRPFSAEPRHQLGQTLPRVCPQPATGVGLDRALRPKLWNFLRWMFQQQGGERPVGGVACTRPTQA